MPAPGALYAQGAHGPGAGRCAFVTCTDPLAGIDIPNLVRETGDVLEDTRREAKRTAFRIRKTSAAERNRGDGE
jgi:tRNA 2-thiouridine synthesizing protein A